MVVKSCTFLQFRLPFDLKWLLTQNFASVPKFRRVLIEYSVSGGCDLKNSMVIVSSLSPSFNIEPLSLQRLLCLFFENEPIDSEMLQNTLIPVIRQNFNNQIDFLCVAQPLRAFKKFNMSLERPRADFTFMADFLEQIPAFQMLLHRNLSIQEAFFLALVCNVDFARADYLIRSLKLSNTCVESFLTKFFSRITLDRTLSLFSLLDMEAKVRVVRSCSGSHSVSQAMLDSISPSETLRRSASLEESLIKTLQKITHRKDAKAAVEFMKKISVESDDSTLDIIIVSNECFAQLLHLTLCCVSKTGDVYLAGKCTSDFAYDFHFS
jgi:hypothetical protein